MLFEVDEGARPLSFVGTTFNKRFLPIVTDVLGRALLCAWKK